MCYIVHTNPKREQPDQGGLPCFAGKSVQGAQERGQPNVRRGIARAKSNFKFKRIGSSAVDRSAGLICDQRGELSTFDSKRAHPERLRRVRFKGSETGKSGSPLYSLSSSEEGDVRWTPVK